jgi:hypothetical protein
MTKREANGRFTSASGDSLTLSSTSLYEAAVEALRLLEEEVRQKALQEAARPSAVQSGETVHITARQFADWLASAPGGAVIVYAYTSTFSWDARDAKNHMQLVELANLVQSCAQRGLIELTQRTSTPPSEKARPFEYRATKRTEPGPPAWSDGWGKADR